MDTDLDAGALSDSSEELGAHREVTLDIDSASDSDDDDLMQTVKSLATATKKAEDTIARAWDDDHKPVLRSAEPRRTHPKLAKKTGSAYKFSVEKLLGETKHQEEVEAEVAQMDAELHESLAAGGIKQQAILYNEQKDKLEKGIELSAEHQAFLDNLRTLSEPLPEEPPWSSAFTAPVDLLLIPSPLADASAEAMRALGLPAPVASALADRAVFQDSVTSGFITTLYTRQAMPDALAEHLFAELAASSDPYFITRCAGTLESLSRLHAEAARAPAAAAGAQASSPPPAGQDAAMDGAAKGTADGAQPRHDLPGVAWAPTVLTLCQLLHAYGSANLAALFPTGDVPELESLGVAAVFTRPRREAAPTPDSRETVLPAANVQQIIKLFTLGIEHHPDRFTTPSLKAACLVMARLCLDERLMSMNPDLTLCMAALLDHIPEAEWAAEEAKLVDALSGLDPHHHNLLHVALSLPCTAHGISLRQRFCLQNLQVLSERPREIPIGQKIEPQHLLQAVEGQTVGEEPAYFYKLRSIVALTDLCVLNQVYSFRKGNCLREIGNQFAKLSTKIKDRQGKYPDRMEVKDNIIRLRSKLSFIYSQNRPIVMSTLTEATPDQKSLTSFYGKEVQRAIISEMDESS